MTRLACGSWVEPRPLLFPAESSAELAALASRLGVRLAIRGGVWGSADVVVASPRESTDWVRVVDVTPEYPHLRAELEVRVEADSADLP